MSNENEPVLPIPDGVSDLTDEIVAAVNDQRRHFSNVIIELATRKAAIDPLLNRLETLRTLRDELNERLGQQALQGSKITGANVPYVPDDPNKPWSTC